MGMTDSAGNLVASYDYDPLGSISGSNVQSGIVNPWQYAGGSYDSTAGSPNSGSAPTIPSSAAGPSVPAVGGTLQETLKANPYEYADNNPVNEIDPNGQISFFCNVTIAFFGFTTGLEFSGIIASVEVAGWVAAGITASLVASLSVFGPAGTAVGAVLGAAVTAILFGVIAYETYQFANTLAGSIGTIKGVCSRYP
ncbi:hypothetical protein [Dictyobacter kobayashii]|uniref:RHS repeat-associated core domain-containing protein n=1 Tax=Dictyobacter kobayashii TaxID=2014872 RepID=A0A402AKJ5_9CHLR|nr:hypothetical protein [Dictyobacter kobayashii]GCE19530.1 hypothetical protein KDK_33300 [Dictyobacter kobayashii]